MPLEWRPSADLDCGCLAEGLKAVVEPVMPLDVGPAVEGIEASACTAGQVPLVCRRSDTKLFLRVATKARWMLAACADQRMS